MQERERPFVSHGRLPVPQQIQSLVEEAYNRFLPVREGAVSRVYPALAEVEPELFGLAVVATDGSAWTAGHSSHPFTIMSVAKPFTFALVCEELGVERATRTVGCNATGFPFDSVAAVERSPDGRTNPMVNSGALATAALLPGSSLEHRWLGALLGLSRLAGRPLRLDERVHGSAVTTNHRNRALAHLLRSTALPIDDPDETVELYTRISCLSVTAHDLAVMGAALADGGVQPVSGEQVLSPATCRAVLALMTTAGLYETSGDWLCEVGLPGKSGIGGGIVTVSPGKGALATFAPRLDAAGNSVRGQRAAQFLSGALGLDLFGSVPQPAAGPLSGAAAAPGAPR